ncbi:MAG: uroporphyrinogen-III C-methyltransferase [Paracoccus sp. (in: a-proteobacteria)]|uniref:uroporphyrinogen-III C-methyltransferase n=1 Tax=Paracoccus sp. TaxID=267 RepID=UPI0026E04F4B|nr:uroporphyrinogen-III C-methyltransferase [Paracoccus sp. (in: a-proteobacteria)]MDO5633173.1 uroporphyrinogen-III C-methyltransferase [Paracoccus sp. (in: a-proteobacteria)]
MSDPASAGFVSLVSAGPGDPELLTVRAAMRLAQADVVLFDDLASGPLLDLAPATARRIPVGKRAGRPSARQDEVNARLIAEARAGHRVVRLKSGDAGIFGRLEEELDALAAAGIGWEIIPGVPSACAAAAAANMPLTRRLTARRLQFVTGADVTGKLPGDLNWAALADAHALTVVFMGQRTFAALAEGLIAHGLPADTPAMLAAEVSKPGQSLTRSTVAGLAALLQGTAPEAPALILYGALAPARGR